jgi:hypothetical protein
MVSTLEIKVKSMIRNNTTMPTFSTSRKSPTATETEVAVVETTIIALHLPLPLPLLARTTFKSKAR